MRRRRRGHGSGGYVLLFIMLLAAVVALGMTGQAIDIVAQVKREREIELVHRGAQYARAIKKFYRKAGRYPTSIEQLENTNQIRFLRKRYKDPVTGEDFRVLRFGDVKLAPKSPGSATNPGVASDQGSQIGQPIGQPLTGSGPSFGGGPVIGVASTSTQKGFMEFNGKSRYNEWEFIYEPTLDRGGLIKGPFEGNKGFGTQTVPGGMPGQPIMPNIPGNPMGNPQTPGPAPRAPW